MLKTRWLLAVLSLALAVGCASSRAASTSANSPTEQKPDPPGPGYLVQYAVDGELETAWLEADGDGYEVVARRSGAYAAAGGDLWTWGVRRAEHELSDCDCVGQMYEKGRADDESLAQCRTTSEFETPVVENLTGDSDLPLAELEDLEQTGDITFEASGESTLGPYWFGTVCTYIYACGAAHGSVGCRSVIVDLERGQVLELNEFMGADAFARANERLRGQAIDALEQKAPDNTEITEAESAQLEAGWPVMTPDGLRFSYLFAAPTCYACSDGSWSSYSIGAHVRDSTLPDKLTSLAKPPAPVLAFIETEDIMNTTRGWTALPDDAERRRALLEAFQQLSIDDTNPTEARTPQ